MASRQDEGVSYKTSNLFVLYCIGSEVELLLLVDVLTKSPSLHQLNLLHFPVVRPS